MQVNIKNLIDDTQCYDIVRELRCPEGRESPLGESRRIIRRGFDEKEPAKQRARHSGFAIGIIQSLRCQRPVSHL